MRVSRLRPRETVMFVHKVECLAQAGQHAKTKHIDFQDTQRIEIILVPFDEGAVVHRRIADRHDLVETAAGEDKTAELLEKMTGEAVDLGLQRRNLAHAPALWVEAGAGDRIFRYRAATATPNRGRQGTDGVFGETKGFSDLADCRAAAIGNHGGGDAGALTPVFPINVLNDFFASF